MLRNDAQRKTTGAIHLQPVGVNPNGNVGRNRVETVGEGIGQQLAQYGLWVAPHLPPIKSLALYKVKTPFPAWKWGFCFSGYGEYRPGGRSTFAAPLF